MMLSMTAFSRQQLEGDWGSLTWEIRSVNHRYLEASVRLPESLRSLEASARDRLRKRLARGKVECQLRFIAAAPEQGDLALNEALIERLLEANKSISAKLGGPTDLNSIDILRWPGVVSEQNLDTDKLESQALELFDKALDDLIANRQREGEAMQAMLLERLEGIDEIVKAVRTRMPEILAAQRQNLEDKIADLKAEVDASRLEAEVALLAQEGGCGRRTGPSGLPSGRMRPGDCGKRPQGAASGFSDAGTEPGSQHLVIQIHRCRHHPVSGGAESVDRADA